MSRISRWAYLHDIEGCDVVRIYALNNLVEFVYLKEGMRKKFDDQLWCLWWFNGLYRDIRV